MQRTPFDLVLQALGFLLLVTDQLASFFLDFAADVLQFAVDLILVRAERVDRGWRRSAGLRAPQR